jgi:hypothetical protein
MSNGFLGRLTFGFTFDVNNLMWSTNACDIFVDCFCSDNILITFSFVNNIVYEFFEFHPLECNPNLFGQFFNPYIFMNLKEFYIPTSLHYLWDPFVHPFVVIVLSMFDYILCPISTSVSCAYDCLLSLVFYVCVFFYN